MAIVAGIDEAGFGPVLGPLVVSAASFRVPDELADVPLWELLAGAVCKRPARKRRLIAIGDSKKLYSAQKPNALEHLERAVLALVAGKAGRAPRTLSGLLDFVAPQSRRHAGRYPWYADGDLPLPRCLTEMDVALAGNALSVAMRGASVELREIRCEPVFEGEFNRLIEATRNKSITLLSVTSRLLDRVWRGAREGLVRIHVDRQGGRMRYLPELQRVFQGCSYKIIEENETLSAYRVADGQKTAEISFSVGCDEDHLPTALASMASKYLRELFMALINRFWLKHVPGLTPTAGYYVDGRRFMGEIRKAVRELNIDERLVYRSR